MSVLVLLHAHPDDEVFTTGGTMRLAADAGHRVVLVTATDGALGEFPDGLLAEGEPLVERRRVELERSAAALGAHRVVQLGYADSGMAGTPANDAPGAFANVDVEVAAARVAEVLAEEGADVFTIYDERGNYGHPDHIAVHRVGVRAAELAGTPVVYEATVNRDVFAELAARMVAAAAERAAAAPSVSDDSSADESGAAPSGRGESAPEPSGAEPSGAEPESAGPPGDVSQLGTPAAEITTTVDVSSVMAAKRAAMVAHASQVGDFGQFLAMEPADLRGAFGVEWFRRRDAPPGLVETALPL